MPNPLDNYLSSPVVWDAPRAREYWSVFCIDLAVKTEIQRDDRFAQNS
jgi:hypothetical protein